MKTNNFFNRYALLAIVGLAAIALLAFANWTMANEDYGLPPRGTQPIVISDEIIVEGQHIKHDGARLQVHALFSDSWPWDELHWQNVWTTIQWYDGKDAWYDVAGWQGNLDAIAQGEAGWVGTKEWWVGKDNLGTGPFRWVIYESQGGPVLVTSEAFNLPETAGKTLILQPTLDAK